jgi:hypothetical protein
LFFCAICLLDVGVWLVLLDLGWGVLEAFYHHLDVCWHQEVHLAPIIVLLSGESAILFPIPIAQTLVVFSNCVQQVLRILLANVLYSKIVDNKGGNNGVGVVLP